MVRELLGTGNQIGAKYKEDRTAIYPDVSRIMEGGFNRSKMLNFVAVTWILLFHQEIPALGILIEPIVIGPGETKRERWHAGTDHLLEWSF